MKPACSSIMLIVMARICNASGAIRASMSPSE